MKEANLFNPNPMPPIAKREFKNKFYQVFAEYAETHEVFDLKEFLEWLKTQ